MKAYGMVQPIHLIWLQDWAAFGHSEITKNREEIANEVQ